MATRIGASKISGKLPKSTKSLFKPFVVDINDEDLKTFEQWLSTRLEESLTASADRISKIEAWRKGYAGEQYKRDLAFEGGANVRIPIAAIMTDAIHMRLVQSHFGVKPYVRVNPPSDNESILSDASRGMESMLWYVHYMQNKLLAGYLTIKDALLVGMGVSKTVWEQEWKLVRDKGKRKYVLRKNLPNHEYIPAEDFIIYPAKAPDVDSAQFVGHRYWRRWDELKRGVSLDIYNSDWVDKIEGKSSQQKASDSDTRQGIKATGQDWKDWPFELFEMIVGYDLDGDGLDEDYLVVIEKTTSTIIRLIEYPAGYGERWYHLYVPKPTGDGIYGESTYDALVGFDEEVTTLHNAQLDNATYVTLPVYTVIEGSPAAKDDKRIKPGERLIVSDHDDVKQLSTVPALMGLGPLEDKLVYYGRLRSGTSDLMGGQVPKGDKTAYEIEATLAEGSIQIRLEVEFGVEWLKRVAWHEMGLMKDFMTDGIYERVTGQLNPLKVMTWEDLWANFDMEPTGNTTTSNRELERQKWVFVTESMKNDPLVFAIDPMTKVPTPKEGWYEIRKQFLLAHGVNDYKSILGPAPATQPAIPQPTDMIQPSLPGLATAQGSLMPTAAGMSNPPTGQEMALQTNVPSAATPGTY